MKTTKQTIVLIDQNGKDKVATIYNAKTIKGALTKLRKSSIACQSGMMVRIEVIIL